MENDIEVLDVYPDENFIKKKSSIIGAGTVTFKVSSWRVQFNKIFYIVILPKNKDQAIVALRMPESRCYSLNKKGKQMQYREPKVYFEDKEKWKQIIDFVKQDIYETIANDIPAMIESAKAQARSAPQ